MSSSCCDSANLAHDLNIFVLLTSRPCKVLTILRQGELHLPQFHYPSRLSYNSDFCCRDLELALDLRPSVQHKRNGPLFRVVAELLPEHDDTLSWYHNPDGQVRLTLVESTCPDFFCVSLPNTVAWTNVSVLKKLIMTPEYGYEYVYVQTAAYQFLDTCFAAPNDALCESEYAHRHCRHNAVSQAVHYLHRVLREKGLPVISDVERAPWNSMATILRVNTSWRRYYLKSPQFGSSEVSVLLCIAKLFPDDTLQIAGGDCALNCFVSEAFEEFEERNGLHDMTIARKLARIQLQSLNHLNALKEAGLPDCSPGVLAGEIVHLLRHPALSEALKEEKVSGDQLTRKLKAICEQVNAYQIPSTLVHGDFELRNFGIRNDLQKDNGIILHDWELACLSHPFCDLLQIYDRWPLSVRDEYLRSWEPFVPLEQARCVVETARPLAWMARMCVLLKFFNLGTENERRIIRFRLGGCVCGILKSLSDTDD